MFTVVAVLVWDAPFYFKMYTYYKKNVVGRYLILFYFLLIAVYLRKCKIFIYFLFTLLTVVKVAQFIVTAFDNIIISRALDSTKVECAKNEIYSCIPQGRLSSLISGLAGSPAVALSGLGFPIVCGVERRWFRRDCTCDSATLRLVTWNCQTKKCSRMDGFLNWIIWVIILCLARLTVYNSDSKANVF